MKKFLFICSIILFIASFIYNFDFVKRIHPDEPYKETLVLGGHDTEREYYTTLREIKGGNALINIKNNGQELVEKGDIIIIDETSSPSSKEFIGEIHILDITENSVTIFTDMKRTKDFYIWNGIMISLLSWLLSYLFYISTINFHSLIKMINSRIKEYKIKKRRNRLKLL